MKKLTCSTTFLFPDSDFITGMGSVLNLAGNYFEFATSASPQEADLKALRSDWFMTGEDLKKSLEEICELPPIEGKLKKVDNKELQPI